MQLLNLEEVDIIKLNVFFLVAGVQCFPKRGGCFHTRLKPPGPYGTETVTKQTNLGVPMKIGILGFIKYKYEIYVSIVQIYVRKRKPCDSLKPCNECF